MQNIWYEAVKKDLELMDKNMARDFRMKSVHVLNLAPVEIEGMDKSLRPALVILMTRLFSGNRAKALTMAAVVQFIHLATIIHNNILDNGDKFKPQFPVLIGDYLYSKFFAYLSQYDALEFLAPLSQVICEMHTGAVVRKEVLESNKGTADDYLDTIQREHGFLTAEACRIAATMSGVSEEFQDMAGRFGLYVGIAWGIVKESSVGISLTDYLDKAASILKQFPAGAARDTLESLLQAIAFGSNAPNLEVNLA